MHKILKSVKSVAIKYTIRNKPSRGINRKKACITRSHSLHFQIMLKYVHNKEAKLGATNINTQHAKALQTSYHVKETTGQNADDASLKKSNLVNKIPISIFTLIVFL